MTFTAVNYSVNFLSQPIIQLSHGFVVGNVIRWNGTAFVLAQADSLVNSSIVGMVLAIQDANSFWLTQVGLVTNVTAQAYTPGDLYYLDPANPGLLTNARPDNVGEIVTPCLNAYSADSGFFFGVVGSPVSSEGLKVETVTADTNMEVNTIYYCDNIVDISMMLPVTASPGDVIKIIGVSTNEILITQSAGQGIIYLDNTTTIGATGGLQLLTTGSTVAGSVELHCYQADTHWTIFTGSGNWDFI